MHRILWIIHTLSFFFFSLEQTMEMQFVLSFHTSISFSVYLCFYTIIIPSNRVEYNCFSPSNTQSIIFNFSFYFSIPFNKKKCFNVSSCHTLRDYSYYSFHLTEEKNLFHVANNSVHTSITVSLDSLSFEMMFIAIWYSLYICTHTRMCKHTQYFYIHGYITLH